MKIFKIFMIVFLLSGFFELKSDEKNKVIKILKTKGFYIKKILKDYSNNDRCIISTRI